MNKLFRQGKNKFEVDGDGSPAKPRGMRIFAERLSALIQEQMDQGVEEADLCREIGVHIRLLGQWKSRGTVTRDERKLWLLCRRLGTHPNYLTGWSDERAPREPPARAAEIDEELRAIKRRLQKR